MIKSCLNCKLCGCGANQCPDLDTWDLADTLDADERAEIIGQSRDCKQWVFEDNQ
jgi:hypothetical protein